MYLAVFYIAIFLARGMHFQNQQNIDQIKELPTRVALQQNMEQSQEVYFRDQQNIDQIREVNQGPPPTRVAKQQNQQVPYREYINQQANSDHPEYTQGPPKNTQGPVPKELWKVMRKYIVHVETTTTTPQTPTPQTPPSFWTVNGDEMLMLSAILVLACNMILTMLFLPLILRFYSRRRVNVGGKQNADGIHHF